MKLNLTANDRRVNRDTEIIRKIAREVITQRRTEQKLAYIKDEDRKDLLDFILEHNKNNPEDKLSDEEIIDNFTTFFIGGLDSTAQFVSYALYVLSKHPEYLTRIMNEATANGVNFDNIKIDDLGSLKFLDSFLKETLRYYTPVPNMVPRRATNTHNLGDLTILKGTVVGIAVNSIAYNEKYFPQPYEFRPERFIEDISEQKTRYPFTYLIFSAGARNCIGKHLAFLEAKTIILLFIKRYSFKLSDPDYKLKLGIRFNYVPVEPVHFDLIKLK
eukprot:TRINITY_DN611_c0_g1_i1.p1 TRINITY_DN611_c0_g1~~TRINITY_DN611_c0_g1_i1.p1  ORF type:complete len:273 (-),score=60.24 TRINITY_DN611_c0_g1_i1:126-944(-)